MEEVEREWRRKKNLRRLKRVGKKILNVEKGLRRLRNI